MQARNGQRSCSSALRWRGTFSKMPGYSSSSSSSSSSLSSPERSSSTPKSPSASSSSSSSSSSSKSSEIRFRWTGCVCDTSSSDPHSGQLRISPSSTSSSSTSISAEHSGQRITATTSVTFARTVAQPPSPPCIVLYTAHPEFNSCASYQCLRYEEIRRLAWLPHENTLSARSSGSAAW